MIIQRASVSYLVQFVCLDICISLVTGRTHTDLAVTVDDILCQCTRQSPTWCVKGTCDSGAPDLAPGVKAKLQFAISATCYTSNQVIATQELCPPQLSLHEFMSFASSRSGAQLQWINLLQELCEGSLLWQTEEMATLVSMLMWQVGCIVNGDKEGTRELEWNVKLKDGKIGEVILHELTLLHRV